MSAFFLSVNRDQTPFDATVADQMMRSIDRFGHDTKRLIVKDNYAIAYQSLWTVPEEQGETQPLLTKQNNCWTCFYGRIDNRDELAALLKNTIDSNASDAQLFCDYFEQFGAKGLKAIIGPFVFAQFDLNSNTVIAARDAMGGRPLCYSVSDEHIHIATYELAIAKHSSVGYQLNQERIARMVVGAQEMQPSSPLSNIKPLKPGEYLTVNDQSCRTQQFYICDPARRIQLASDQAYADEFKRLLNQAVKRRCRSLSRVASMMSGGMDSVPISIAAAQQLASTGQTLTALSWVFDKYPECDEREYSAPVCEQFNIEQVAINCDEAWPSFDQYMHINPVVPFSIPFSEYQQSALRSAKQYGARTVLSGIHGDLLYEGTESILFEFIKRGQWRNAWNEGLTLAKAHASKKAFIKQYLVAPLPIVKQLLRWLRARRRANAPLLTQEMQSKLPFQQHYLDAYSRQALRPYQYQIVLGHEAGEDLNYGRYMDAKFGIERRYPFRDRDLVEFMLAIPSEQLFYKLNNRPIVKRAFYQELPEGLQKRNLKTDFSRVIQVGILRDNNAKAWFTNNSTTWQNYINSDIVKKCYFDEPSTQKNALNVVAWRCAYYEYWKSVCYTDVTN